MNDNQKKPNQQKKKANLLNGKKLLFLESIGDRKTPRDVMLKNLIRVLEKNGFKIKNKK
tara:strand:+ start:527 stop:703 length:177 start_codon:yes stop_codon:yes gene_type:complete